MPDKRVHENPADAYRDAPLLSTDQPAPLPNFSPRYEIIAAMEGGAQASAYRARDLENGDEVFIKCIAWNALGDWKTHEL